ncbi:formyl transferase, partial [Candidatus Micrarchaeota archaeon]|nr:formyl transferase [Candidatus Micrarchaeota archaeon]
MDNNQIVILSGPHESTKLIYNSLKSDFHVERVIIEDKVQLIQFLRKRVKRLGLIHVTGQVLFRLLIQFPLSVLSKNRMQKIKERYGLDNAPIDKNIVSRVTSANSPKTIELLKSIQPKIVILNGTRIISEEVLKCTNAVFVNIHAGITPRYRGSHGAYWAIVEDNLEECGVTVHIVDTGIDTGTIIG